MTAPTRRALLRELSAHPDPERPLIENDPSPAYAAALRRDYLALLVFAATICRVEPTRLTPLDLMANLSNLKGARAR